MENKKLPAGDPKTISFKQFLALPAGKQLVLVGFRIIIFLVSAITGIFVWEENSKSGIRKEDAIVINDLTDRLSHKDRKCSEKLFSMAQKYEHEKNEAVQKELADAKAKLAEREKDVDDAIRITKQVLETQAKTQQKVRKIRTVVSKIVTK